MSRKLFKKSLSVFMAATMLVCMTGCGSKEGGSTKKEEKVDSKNFVYEGNVLTIDGMKGDVGTFKVQGDKMYISTYEWQEGSVEDAEDTTAEEETAPEETTEEVAEESTSEEATEETASEEESTSEETTEEAAEENTSEEGDTEESASEEDAEEIEGEEGVSKERLYVANLDGTGATEIPLSFLKQEKDYQEYINNILVNESGEIVVLLNGYEEKKDKTVYYIVKIDESGKELDRVDITEKLKLGEESFICSVVMDEKGRIVFVLDASVVILDEKYNVAGELKADEYLSGAGKTKDGQIVCAFCGEDGCSVKVLDIDGKKWGETYKIDLAWFSGSEAILNGNDYDFYYTDDSGIYGYTIADQKGEKLMDYVASDMSTSSTFGMVPVNKDTILGMSFDEGCSIMKYTKVDPSTIQDKEVITVGAMYVDDEIKKVAINFNKENTKYKIEFKDYSSEEDPITKMNADILAGNVPDVIMLSGLPVEQYIAKGVLEDLMPYFEKEEEIKTSDFVQPVFNAMKTGDSLYYIAPNFTMNTLIGSSKDVGTEMGWNYEDMKAALEKKGDQARLFYSANKLSMMNNIIYQGVGDFVNWETGECTFDSQEFRDILEICNTGSNEEDEYSDDSPTLPSLIKEGKVLLADAWVTLEQLQMYEQMFNEDITLIGYPCADKNGSYFELENQMAIYSKSEKKDAAWEFIRTFMTKDYQGKSLNGWSSPIRQDCFDMMIKASTTTEKYTDEFGNEVYPVDSTSGYDDLEVKIGPSSQEEVDMYMDLLNHTTRIGSYDSSILQIIEEEAKDYFAGEKSLDDTVKVIQNRVTTYVNENR